MDIRILILAFLRIEHLTQDENFSPLVDFGASVDYYNVLRSCLLLLNILEGFNLLSKSVLELKSVNHMPRYSQFSIEEPARSRLFRKTKNFLNSIFSLFLTKNIKLKHFQSKLIEISLKNRKFKKIEFFDFSEKL